MHWLFFAMQKVEDPMLDNEGRAGLGGNQLNVRLWALVTVSAHVILLPPSTTCSGLVLLQLVYKGKTDTTRLMCNTLCKGLTLFVTLHTPHKIPFGHCNSADYYKSAFERGYSDAGQSKCTSFEWRLGISYDGRRQSFTSSPSNSRLE